LLINPFLNGNVSKDFLLNEIEKNYTLANTIVR